MTTGKPEPSTYKPVQRMQQKAEELRLELEAMAAGGGSVAKRGGAAAAAVGEQQRKSVVFPEGRDRTRSAAGDNRKSDALTLEIPATASFRSPPEAASPRPRGSGRAPATPLATALATPRKNSSGVGRHHVEANLRLQAEKQQLEGWVLQLREQVAQLRDELSRKEASYMRREDRLKEEIGSLQAEKARREQEALQTARDSKRDIPSMQQLQVQMSEGIGSLLEKQRGVLKVEENDLLKQFRRRLNDIERDVAAERRDSGHEEGKLLEQTMELRQELASTQDLASKLDRMHKLSSEECQRLRAQYHCQEDDREFLVRQMLHLKHDNARLHGLTATLQKQLDTLTTERDSFMAAASHVAPPATRAQHGAPARPVSAAAELTSRTSSGTRSGSLTSCSGKHDDVIVGLRKMVETERRRAQQARAAHVAELQNRTSMQALLRRCVDDIRQQRRRLAGDDANVPATSSGADATDQQPRRSGTERLVDSTVGDASRDGSDEQHGTTSTAASDQVQLSSEERSTLIDQLTSREHILKLVFDRAFPGALPHAPKDPYVSRLAERQAAAKAGGAATQGRDRPGSGQAAERGRGATEATQEKPWVLNVDAMLAEFMGPAAASGPRKA